MAFGNTIDGIGFRVLDERAIRASAGLMFLLGLVASINGFVLNRYEVVPYISGFLAINFIIGIFINANYAPTYLLARLIVRNQTPIYIGAIQKRFAWSLGLGLSAVIFGLSLKLQTDATMFDSVCLLCIICLVLLFSEASFGICIGCKIYQSFVKIGIMKEPESKPNCMGDTCEV